eukprot:TRINITY_DN5806_c0_g1_i1.p1 TRINITY_DN5806_c0_g1~~TRINITY_DN5806_c0_g1_i1.p1  ORF type:complete len:574 (-),score=142.03 TRINITY_DN5806_c0_g1_i1:264-1985(-)
MSALRIFSRTPRGQTNGRFYSKASHSHEGHSLSTGRADFARPMNEPIADFSANSALRRSVDQEIAKMKSQIVEIPLIIGGREVFTNNVQDVRIPHDHKHVIARFHKAGPEHTQLAIEAALKAKKEWASLDFEMRALFFHKVAELVAGPWRAKILAATMLNQSKNYFQAEIDAAAEFIDFLRFNNHFAQKIYSDQPLSTPAAFNRVAYRPLEGFIYAVSPFNFTSIAGNLSCAPALMGNTTIWKPSDHCVLSNYVLMRVLMEAGLPAGVINFIPGDAEAVSNVAYAHKEFAGLHFTGSTEVFKGIFQKVSANLHNYRGFPRLVGETGGKNFVLAHSSADVAAVAAALIRGSFEYAGQKCSASSRAFVPASMWNNLKNELMSQLKDVKMGNPELASTLVNAVIHKGSYDRCVQAIESAKKDSSCEMVYTGESSDSVGYFVHPTIVKVSNPEHFLMQKEFFGPILAVHVYEDNAFEQTCHAIDRTSAYALTGSIFAQDRLAISKAANLLEHCAGNFYINDKPTGAVVGQQPFGGARASGTNDKAGSLLNLLRWTSPRTMKETFVPPTHFKYPYMDS